MGSSKKFWMGMVLGALAGGAVSLLDKATRQSVKEDFSKVSNGVAYVVKNPENFIEDIKDAANKVRSTVEQVTEDVAFITEKVEEVRDVPPQVTELVKGTKETLRRIAASDNKQPHIDENEL
ncbi:YtxH domain-containing protein [Mesobacillus subterraneus]|uniref:YtxH domain-containing protein n=1 Tax=Mesobacillus subterraneus TaxID=285983 RepID=UPI00203B342E|nr:YtxH domain-containing protein [Mesobacillus subterraneus]MCM3667204.1 YtxH domain-containing protein [Mesobacillus subterraneus]MCM3686033.1 YtxH domain-containing protein [Mesobacillus subterraneus]